MGVGREAYAILGLIIGTIVLLTLLGGGSFLLGTSRGGPYASVGYTGAYRAA